ncbi:DEHA2D00770p [Debaryomyces hansenii CBS767]|uniref:DEHA2D00770p n=1 Tax=Debaryomyces hansenii (strain ATCC 36239 / CBS 767 / BCRC 21394 / JCM 1990 / NBRC 0083 / IGC 2968) TaxID=284592 RepID=Q6BTG7_DEBHA|nr:DEHA2D00770p [Debaryomyces hansenii CBS767]CAG86617.2 DEHA2D00770p [Debaryomyces hansenii CBS767]|eukprot:XP_458502.2 DEHA2D00770p [Debaryomyces hansenii CBS767]
MPELSQAQDKGTLSDTDLCDEARPACEYCAHRNRECIYPDIQPKLSTNAISTNEQEARSYSLSTSQSQKSLNSMSSLIGISSFEYQLICYYQNLCEFDFRPHPNPKMNVWFKETQRLGFHSDLVRNCIYAISTMHLDNLDFYESIKGSKLVQSPQAIKFFNCHLSIFEPNQLRGFHQGKVLYNKTVQYFLNSVKQTMDIINDIESGNGPHSTSQAIEILISSLIIFNLLSHHHAMFLPLIAHDLSQPNLLSICMGMKHVKNIIVPYLEESSFGILFKGDTTTLLDSKLCNRISLIEQLKDYRLILEERDEIQPHESLIYIDSIKKLEDIMYKIIISNNQQLIWGWIGEQDDEFYILANEKKKYFACKLLFYYSSLRVILTGRTSYQGNTWTFYCHWFKNYNLAKFGHWRDPKDFSLYKLVFSYDYEVKDLNSFLATNQMTFESK